MVFDDFFCSFADAMLLAYNWLKLLFYSKFGLFRLDLD